MEAFDLQKRLAELERENARLGEENARLQRALRELGARERDLLSIVEHTPAPIYVKDADHAYLHVNPCFERVAQIPLAIIRGRTDYDLFPKATADLFRDQDREVMAAGEAREFEETIPLPGGEYTFITVKFPLLGADGSVRALAGFCTDITGRKKDEREREALIGQLRQALEEVDTLRGILPICSWCQKIRDDQGYWSKLEAYVSRHAQVEFTHGICPSCEEKVRAEEV